MENLLNGEKLLSAKQTSQILGTSRPTLSRIKDEIGYFRIGNTIKFTEENVAAYLRRVERQPVIKNGGDE